MTAVWGPMGWMTLHSISVNYPENPNSSEKLICSRFLELIGGSMTCRFCKEHYERMLESYKNSHPEFLNSRRDLFLFLVRAHNTVNKRLDKPLIKSVSEALETLKQATAVTSPATYRKNYIYYLIRNWSYDTTGDGLFAKQKARELEKINVEYWNLRETDYDIEIEEGDTLEFIQENGTRISSSGVFSNMMPPTNVGFKGGKLRLGRR